MKEPPAGETASQRWNRGPTVVVVLLVALFAVGVYMLTRRAEVPEDVPIAEALAGGETPRGLQQFETGDHMEPLIDPDEMISGGPPPDGIPPIDDPRFITVGEVDWLAENEPVIAVEIKREARAYPLQIMTWHEIVNDTVAELPITVTFCPLCNTAYGYVRPVVDGKLTTFGTSGRLYNSNLVMYDRATKSLWPQALGTAVVGSLTGSELNRIPAQIVAWHEFRDAFPDGLVLSRDTGFSRSYGQNPYPGYDDVDSAPFLFSGEVDGRLAAVERILGIEHGDEVIAFPYHQLEGHAVNGATAINASIDDHPALVVWKEGTTSALDDEEIASSKDVGSAAAYSRRLQGRILTFHADGVITDDQTGSTWNVFGLAIEGPLAGSKLRDLDYHDSFWFDWAAFHPDTTVWEGPGR